MAPYSKTARTRAMYAVRLLFIRHLRMFRLKSFWSTICKEHSIQAVDISCVIANKPTTSIVTSK